MSKLNDSDLVQITAKIAANNTSANTSVPASSVSGSLGFSGSSGISRRSFLKVLGATSATALTACANDAAEKIIPYTKAETESIPGVSVWYNSTCTECSAGCGISIRTREGRAVKVEGSSLNPINKGGLCGLGQASLQDLYDPDRVRQPLKKVDGPAGKPVFKPISWDQAFSEIAEAISKAQETKKSVAFVSEDLGSGAIDKLVSNWCQALTAKHVVYNALEASAWASATEILFGTRGLPQLDFEKPEVVLNFGADFLETWISPCEYAKSWANGRRKETPTRHIHIETRASLTAANADHVFINSPGSEQALAFGILRALVDAGKVGSLNAAQVQKLKDLTSGYSLDQAALQSGISKDKLDKTVKMLLEAKQSLVIAGGSAAQSQAGLAVSLAAQLMNVLLGNLGTSFDVSKLRSANSSARDIEELSKNMADKNVGVLFVHKTNPAFSLPADFNFSYAMKFVPLVVSFSSQLDETATNANLILPASAGLETWGDLNPMPGIHSLIQPAMTPVFDTKDLGEILIKVAAAASKPLLFGDLKLNAESTFLSVLKEHWKGIHAQNSNKAFEDFWKETLEKGGIFNAKTTASKASFVGISDLFANSIRAFKDFANKGAEKSELVLYPFCSVKGFDGRAANRPWMQELPDPMTQIVWDSWVEIHPETARALGIEKGDSVSVRNYYGELNLPAYLSAHVAKNVVAVPLGQGHTAYGRYASASSDGGNVFNMLPASKTADHLGVALYSTKVEVSRSRGVAKMISAQKQGDQSGREIARTTFIGANGLIASPKKAPHFHHSVVKEHSDSSAAHAAGKSKDHGLHASAEHHDQPIKQMYNQREFPIYKWGMAIDLNACTGCSACVVACYAENNIPVVGREQVDQGRRMSWLQINRYDDGSSEDLQVSFMPMTCQHCGNAPCEPVCPVYATYHNEEGLNAMIYNRCVGTRYCANNCSYKVRRFNWFEYEFPEPLNFQLNPDVTKRTAGVMEKCTFCVQRIVEAKDAAKDLGRMVKDGEVKPACVQSCPTEALVFGNLNDPESKVSKTQKDSRAYKLLDYHLNTQPSVSYLDRVKFEKI
jgi:anaerobic selenocysteine-containing dehydrogenase/Fe-S-cluster-containing dehydrogenase component